MDFARFQQLLASNFNPTAAGTLDAVFELRIGSDVLTFHVSHGSLDFDLPADTRPDATFRFADAETAWALLSGQSDAFQAFMQGRFRSDGYLMWAFALMTMFQSASLPPAPTE